jgi:hypothetical protein
MRGPVGEAQPYGGSVRIRWQASVNILWLNRIYIFERRKIMATKKKTPNDIYEEVKAMAVSKTTTFEEEIPEPSVDDQIDMLKHEKESYQKKIDAVDKKLKKLEQQKVYEEAAEALRSIRDTCLAGGMSEQATDEVLKSTFMKSIWH